jgi:SpoVK/Ycf46/Vps4 family AAA+-type ATPase
VGIGRFDEAEEEYSAALAASPNDISVMLGLANVAFLSGKYSKAMVLVEECVRRGECPAAAFVLQARLLLNEGHVKQAVEQYKRAVSKEPAVADTGLAERLGIGADADSELVDGKLRAGVNRDPDDDDELDDRILESSDIKFSHVGGMEAVKEQIRLKIIYPLTHAETFKAYGKKVGGGLLMYGPPGCGKTYLAKATAGEINARFVSVGLHQVLDMWIGSSERNLHDLFELARGNKPCVLFFDEVDALAASRSDMKHNAGRHIINQFLNELDGVDTDNDGLLILAATNAPWHVDPAFRRPGRFDRILFVPPPDAVARGEILRILLRDKPMENVDFDHIGKKTEKFSGADLKALVDNAIESKIQEAMKTGIPKPISTKDLERSMKDIKPSTTEWFATARNYAVHSNQGGQYDDILKYLKI